MSTITDPGKDKHTIKIIETPRDGMQGLKGFVPTEIKISYINQLLLAGFDTVEAGSFVSHSAVPQMKDTAEVLHGLASGPLNTRIMVLAGNARGGRYAAADRNVSDILYPYSVSPTFLKKNLNTDRERSHATIIDLREICETAQKRLIVYLTMGFGNPYGDMWSEQLVVDQAGYLHGLGLRVIPLSDIMGNVTPGIISGVFNALTVAFPDVEFGIHLHTTSDNWREKVDAAWESGVRRYDCVAGGFGGCPMAGDELVSNLDTFDLVRFCEERGIPHGLDLKALQNAREILYSAIKT